ncbi:hypothetical protein GQ53DRAFT_226763 [Thozetella sp. PMI_491]|nr:hypothetical protein GQ53DRAFT_226763 [Thozetella sp. PMI_491]
MGGPSLPSAHHMTTAQGFVGCAPACSSRCLLGRVGGGHLSFSATATRLKRKAKGKRSHPAPSGHFLGFLVYAISVVTCLLLSW